MTIILYTLFDMFVLFLTVILFGVGAHCTNSKPLPNSLGLDQVYENHNVYLFAQPVEGSLVGDDKFTNVRFAPYHTPSLYDETVLFCGDVSDSFISEDGGLGGPMVVTYDRIAHRMYQGIGCHDLVSVFPVTTKGDQ